MSISSALNASVAGLRVNATRLATISDNIANSATFGYKRSAIDFSSQVIKQQQNSYSAGGVSASVFRDVQAQGSLIGTGSSTDLAVAGRGLIPVTDEAGTTQLASARSLSLTSTGSFSADQNGFLRTSGGAFLLGWEADTNGNIINVSRDSGAGLVPINVNINQFVAAPTTTIDLGVNLPADATNSGSTGDPFTLPIEYFDNLGRSQTLTLDFTPQIPASGSSNQWSVSVLDSATIPAAPIASFDIEFDTSVSNGGSILNITNTTGTTYDPVTGTLVANAASGPIDLFVGRINDSAGLTQLAGPFSPNAVTKNGAPIGNLNAVEIDNRGFLEAIYDTGFRRVLYQIPVADVPNLNGLTPLADQGFAVSQSSGDLYFWDSGTGPVGVTTGFSLMESTTDVAAELTDLIETQRAYSSNATVVQTVDEILQETSNLGR